MKINNFKNYIVELSATINTSLQKLNNNQHKILFVTENGKLKGSISDGDIRRKLLKNKNLSYSKDCMNSNPSFIYKNDDDYNKIKLILQKKIFIVPVLNELKEIQEIIDLRSINYLPIDVVIMAGGRGQRLSPLTNNTPKPLIKLKNKAIIDYNYERLVGLGVKSFYISVNYLKAQIKDHFRVKKSVRYVDFIEEEKPLGTFGSLSLIDDFKNDNVMVINSDILTDVDFNLFYEKFIESNCEIGLISIEYSTKIPYAILNEKNSRLINFEEKPSYNYLINTGIYLLKKSAISKIPYNEFYNATDLIKNFINGNKKVFIHKVNNYWKDIGSINDLSKAKKDISNIFNHE